MKNFNMKIMMSAMLLTSFAAQAAPFFFTTGKNMVVKAAKAPFSLTNWNYGTGDMLYNNRVKGYVVAGIKCLPFFGPTMTTQEETDTGGKKIVKKVVDKRAAGNFNAENLVNTTMNLVIIGCCVYTAKKQIYDRFIAKKLTKLEKVQEDVKVVGEDIAEVIKS